MKLSVKSATLEKYNANNRGKNVGDCVKRAISIAFDLPYSEVSKILNTKMKELRKTQWNIMSVFIPVMEELGATKTPIGNYPTLEEWVDTQADPSKTYILLVGKKQGGTDHLVCVRNGKIWDSWDSRDRIITSCWTVNDDVQHKELTDIKDHLVELSDDYIYPVLYGELEKQMKKRGMDGLCTYFPTFKNYTIKTKWKLVIEPDDIVTKVRSYTLEIAIPFEPTTTMEEAIKFIQTTGKTRMYDRMYAVADQEKKLHEEYEMRAKTGREGKGQLWLDSREQAFYNTLPGWARALITHIDIQNPEQWSDSYTIKMHKLPDDDRHPDERIIYFEDYNADGIRYQLKRYKDKFELAGEDYERDW